MKKLISLLLIIFMIFGVAIAESEDDYDDPPKRKASEEEIYQLLEDRFVKYFTLNDYPVTKWHEKGPKININQEFIKKHENISIYLVIYDVHIEDVLFEYPYYSIIAKIQGVRYFVDIIAQLLDNNTLLTKKFIPSLEDDYPLGWEYSRVAKIYAMEDEGKLKFLDIDYQEYGGGSDEFENFKTNYENFRGFLYNKHLKEGYKTPEEYYYDQFIKAMKGEDVDENIHFQLTYSNK